MQRIYYAIHYKVSHLILVLDINQYKPCFCDQNMPINLSEGYRFLRDNGTNKRTQIGTKSLSNQQYLI